MRCWWCAGHVHGWLDGSRVRSRIVTVCSHSRELGVRGGGVGRLTILSVFVVAD